MEEEIPDSGLVHIIRSLFRNELRSLFIFVSIFVAVGTVFYRIVEGWSWLDSYYFSVMTLTTVGYGDIAPATDWGKLFTTLYVFGGLGIVFAFLQVLARHQINQEFLKKLIEQTKRKR